ncbi:hypothetical protein HF325_000335 [Metschnikowia pulcherrima]|uniref:Protein kinase domain-containing protein n=1 Tax=Metschnikowia pulcherrima TaxID=27326 RepID=A0A8H7GWS7_9ASCO|nr:hypothetical protein HF325_000335 [Metschnikowia pulcherrima]
MSVVPYRGLENGRIVYHDPASQILVVHNNRDNSVELYGSDNFSREIPESFSPFSPGTLQHQKLYRNSPSDTDCCPNCGANIGDFLEHRNLHFSRRDLPNQRSRSSSYRGSHSGNDSYEFPPFFSPGVGTHFMDQDYFHLLAELPFDVESTGRALEGSLQQTEDGIYTKDFFNQGYFSRFFRKIPPGILGSGAHAQVFKVAHVLKDIQLGVFAVKRINVGDHILFLDQVLNEVLILYELSVKGANENNLIRYNHVWMEYGELNDLATFILDPYAEKSVKVPYVYILQQYCDGGHLENVINRNFLRHEQMSMKERLDEERSRRRGRKNSGEKPAETDLKVWLSELEIWKFFADITNGVAYLHAHGILHRDLKPSNCLLESEYVPGKGHNSELLLTEDAFEKTVSALPKVLVSDFGEGKFLNKKPQMGLSSVDDERRGNTGTLEFTDPKLWLYDHPDNLERKPKFAHQFTYDSDIYSLGMILCYLCVGKLPFADVLTNMNNPELVRQEIADWHINLTPESFQEWFEHKNIAIKGGLSPILDDFRVLIYLMIKGQPGTSKPSPEMTMQCLDSIKWRRFILQRNRSRSAATITDMGNLSPYKSSGDSDLAKDKEESEDEETETVDLVALKNTHRPKSRDSLISRGALFYDTFVIKGIYIFNVLLLELFASKETLWVTFTKLINVLCLAIESTCCNDYRMQLVLFSTCVSVCALAYFRG